jgi:cell division septum initiation protein DivIVA
MLLCVGVLVQTSRLMRKIKVLRSTSFKAMIQAMDRSAEESRIVIAEMKETLGGCVAANNMSMQAAQNLRDELSLITDLANAAADRIISSVTEANEHPISEVVSFLKQEIGSTRKGGC